MTDSAKAAIGAHAEAINNRDATSYAATMNYPFTYQNYNGVALTLASPAECGVSSPYPWDIILTTDPEWSHTRFDAIDEIASSPSSVVFKVTFCRVDLGGQLSSLYDAIWIVTCQGGVWGVQFRHNLGARNDTD